MVLLSFAPGYHQCYSVQVNAMTEYKMQIATQDSVIQKRASRRFSPTFGVQFGESEYAHVFIPPWFFEIHWGSFV